MSFTVDASEIYAFAAGLRTSAHAIRGGQYAVVSKGGVNIKNDARKNLHGQLSGKRTSLWWLEPSITYDMEQIPNGWEAEIGPDQSISGLGVGTEYGSIHHGPIPFLIPAFNTEASRFEAAAQQLVDRAYGI